MARSRKRAAGHVTRRRLTAALGALSLGAISRPAWAIRTPASSQGPFYPTGAMRFADADNNLVRIAGRVERAGGEVIVLKGRVLEESGAPVAGARVEIWQCDANGRYLHSGDRGGPPRDPAFQGFGHVVTGPDGGYAFRTIKPVPYPGRAPHIHVKAFYAGRELTTQFYIAGHRQNTSDFLFRRLSAAERKLVSMNFRDGPDGPETVVDIVL